MNIDCVPTSCKKCNNCPYSRLIQNQKPWSSKKNYVEAYRLLGCHNNTIQTHYNKIIGYAFNDETFSYDIFVWSIDSDELPIIIISTKTEEAAEDLVKTQANYLKSYPHIDKIFSAKTNYYCHI